MLSEDRTVNANLILRDELADPDPSAAEMATAPRWATRTEHQFCTTNCTTKRLDGVC